MAVADNALRDHGLGHLVEAVGAILRADLHDALRRLYGAHDLLRLFHAVRQRLLDVDVLARGQGVEQHAVVQMFGSGDEDSVHFLVGQQITVVEIGLGRVQPLGLDDVLALSQVGVEGIADRRDSDLRGIAGVSALLQVAAARAGANPAQIDAAIGSSEGRQNGRCGGQGGGLHQAAAGEFLTHL